ncbi:MAG: HD domain-containing phosphohydrolase [Planctomycetota bacterium]
MSKLGFNFAVCSEEGELLIQSDGGRFVSDKDRLISAGAEVLGSNRDDICKTSKDGQILAANLRIGDEAFGTALIDVGGDENNILSEREGEYLAEILSLLQEKFQDNCEVDTKLETFGTELSQTYEELILLHKLSTNMKITESDSNFLQIACDGLTDIVSVEGIAILVERFIEDEKKLILTAGSGLIDMDDYLAFVIQSRLEEELKKGKEALLDSQVDTPFKYNWSESIKNLIVVPLYGKDKIDSSISGEGRFTRSMIGLMVAVNRVGKPDFDSIDIKLFNSVANSCAVFIENERLFVDLKELFIGSLKALTRSIDAKDQYTRGHSERVAFISRWIAERYIDNGEGLDEKHIHKIYLAGLLHDIGKIGINEAVLLKKGKLTEEEIAQIERHPSIGANILYGIKQMRDIVPGVLYHHERIDGKGYPERLLGKEIPLIGKIIGMADSFDAMTSKRVYRNAMSIKQALAEIEACFGSQFDEKVGRTFLNSDIDQLWNIVREGVDEFYGLENLSGYDTVAVGTLIR